MKQKVKIEGLNPGKRFEVSSKVRSKVKSKVRIEEVLNLWLGAGVGEQAIDK